MSRIGKIPIQIPKGVEVKHDLNKIDVKGPKGFLTRSIHSNITIKVEDGKIIVTRPNDTKLNKSLHGLSRALINNMVKGVMEGYEKRLQIVGVGYRALMEGKDIVFNLGYSHQLKVKIVEGITFEIDKKGDVIVRGIDKELVGQMAANIRNLRKPDPYKGKGIRYSDEVIIKKVGKTGAGAK